MMTTPEDRNISHLETHQHSPSCVPMAISLQRIGAALTLLCALIATGLGLALVAIMYWINR